MGKRVRPDPIYYEAIHRCETLDELVRHVEARQPAVFHCPIDAEAWRQSLLQQFGDERLPVRYGGIGARPRSPYARLMRYLIGAMWSTLGRKATLNQLLGRDDRWAVSGIDLQSTGSTSTLGGNTVSQVLDALMLVVPRDPDRAEVTGCWLSSAGCVTDLHWDAFGPHNFHLLTAGSKRAVLFAPSEAARLYCYGGLRYLLRFAAAVDVGEPDLRRFPAFAAARGVEAHLEPGDVLFIPAYWWHYFKSLSELNASFTHWWFEPSATHPREPPLRPFGTHLNLVRYLLLDPALEFLGSPLTAAALATALLAWAVRLLCLWMHEDGTRS
jgi:hypothetical protein